METAIECPEGFEIRGHRVAVQGDEVLIFLDPEKGQFYAEDLTARLLAYLHEEGFVDIDKAKVEVKMI